MPRPPIKMCSMSLWASWQLRCNTQVCAIKCKTRPCHRRTPAMPAPRLSQCLATACVNGLDWLWHAMMPPHASAAPTGPPARRVIPQIALSPHKYVYASRVHRGSAVHGSEACRQRRQWRRQAHASSSTMQLMECPAAHAWPCNSASYECCRLTSQLASKLLGITPLNASETEGPRLGSLFSGTERVEGCTYLYVHGPP